MDFQEKIRQEKSKRKIIMLTAYDFQIAKILDTAGIDLILVGDSLGMVVQGHNNTKNVTMTDMIYHMKAVAKGVKNTPIIGDMPINSHSTIKDGLANAMRFMEAGAAGVKIEGNKPKIVEALMNADIPVMGHVGMLPQGEETYRVKGKKPEEAKKILQDAVDLDRLGVFSIVLECIPQSLAKEITEKVRAPTIGIGAGRYYDGQVLVINDMLGLDETFKPKYVKIYANLNKIIKDAVTEFSKEVSTDKYPDEQHTYH
jgi:3-methyl-2-oxobutanoate hydroxymethyltransferase